MSYVVLVIASNRALLTAERLWLDPLASLSRQTCQRWAQRAPADRC